MQVFKFGGASVKDAAGVKNLENIIRGFGESRTLIVVSAMGKTTNKLEELVSLVFDEKPFHTLWEEIKTYHHDISVALLGTLSPAYKKLEDKLEEALNGIDRSNRLLAYDQIVPFGELMSTTLIHDYLNAQRKDSCQWMDARRLIRTDQYFSEANVDWVVTEKQVWDILKPAIQNQIVITQGFIGSDVEGNTTTLGREGSDFTGAILAYCLNADQLTVWKDVPGILNADPRILSDTEQYENLSYREVTEMTYYGAQVIHPKTLKPIAQKGIPLMVRSFLHHDAKGTVISSENTAKTIPCFVFKSQQLLVTAQVKDHSFMDEKKLGLILQVLDLLNIKINLMQNSALTFSFCIDNKAFKLKRIKELLNRDFILSFEMDLHLATIKNYTEASFGFLPKEKEIIMEQKTASNYQVLYRQEEG